ncbi:bifunctional diaminohydroxyphosphoribosylaminopyrimidine deaminase/5-amino-6-(5-phosphoribosylamino)uracil reductase RibD [Candidatus Peregrinibacteria bacterium]|nr:bifunctional diaminohydroxyphosphoribosylaminopyrimidine deaminase/5-amino-6-(5-phosphoribosylamino)uracil reductase RibD [Candidatus Peregrinibacteria bacterium]
MKKEIDFMRRAIELAKKGVGRVAPNPCVGCVIVKNDRIVGEGWHKRFGGPHAEIEALKKAGSRACGAVMYVTLEPCCHFGKTPPCTDAIIKSKVREVFAAMIDPSLHANSKGIKILRAAGIRTQIGLCEKEALAINQIFLKNVRCKLPYVTLKVAASLDGKIAARTGDSTGISCKKSLKFVHELRSEHDAVLVGAGTILADNPHLGVRLIKGKSPIRVILAGGQHIPASAKVFRDKNVIVFDSRRNINFVLKKLFERGVRSVLVEGGEKVFTSFLEAGAVDRYIAVIAPKLIGGARAKTPFSGKGIGEIKSALILKNVEFIQIGCDMVIDGLLNLY